MPGGLSEQEPLREPSGDSHRGDIGPQRQGINKHDLYASSGNRLLATAGATLVHQYELPLRVRHVALNDDGSSCIAAGVYGELDECIVTQQYLGKPDKTQRDFRSSFTGFEHQPIHQVGFLPGHNEMVVRFNDHFGLYVDLSVHTGRALEDACRIRYGNRENQFGIFAQSSVSRRLAFVEGVSSRSTDFAISLVKIPGSLEESNPEMIFRDQLSFPDGQLSWIALDNSGTRLFFASMRNQGGAAIQYLQLVPDDGGRLLCTDHPLLRIDDCLSIPCFRLDQENSCMYVLEERWNGESNILRFPLQQNAQGGFDEVESASGTLIKSWQSDALSRDRYTRVRGIHLHEGGILAEIDEVLHGATSVTVTPRVDYFTGGSQGGVDQPKASFRYPAYTTSVELPNPPSPLSVVSSGPLVVLGACEISPGGTDRSVVGIYRIT